MGRCSWLAVGLGLVLTASGGRAEDAYTIKIKEPGKGDVLQVTTTDSTRNQSKLLDPAGDKVLSETGGKTERTLVYRETVLEKEAGKHRATELKRQYEKAQMTVNDKTTAFPYQGKALLIERKGKEYRFRIEGGNELKGADARMLEQEFNQDPDLEYNLREAILPKKAVAVNDPWKLDMAAIAASYEKMTKMPIDAARAEGGGKLVKVYQKDGARFGVLTVHLDMPLKDKEIGEGPGKIALQPGGKWIIDLTLEGCIDGSRSDGSRTSDSQLSATGQVALPNGQKARAVLSFKSNSRETTEEVKK
jgi:hypothetical protein